MDKRQNFVGYSMTFIVHQIIKNNIKCLLNCWFKLVSYVVLFNSEFDWFLLNLIETVIVC